MVVIGNRWGRRNDSGFLEGIGGPDSLYDFRRCDRLAIARLVQSPAALVCLVRAADVVGSCILDACRDLFGGLGRSGRCIGGPDGCRRLVVCCSWVLSIKTGRVLGKKVVVFVFLWMPISFTSGTVVLDLSGFCVNQMRKWTDDELIELVVAGHLQIVRIDDIPPSTEAILKSNPRCCAVRRIGGPFDLLDGMGISEVEINYELSPDYMKSRGLQDRYYKDYIAINACGRVLKSTRGMESDTLGATGHVYRERGGR